MYREQMTIEELAMYYEANGIKVENLDGTWWVEVRPCFFRPLFPFEEVRPGARRYPLKSLVGGLIHLVPSGIAANCTMNFLVYDDLQDYSLDGLSKKRRLITKQGLKNFCVRQITDINDFIDDAYDIYVSFYKRTKYDYMKSRLEKTCFREWARTLFDNPKIVKLGAYRNDTLSAIEISYYVRDVIVGDTLFSDQQSLNLKATDCILHTMREAAVSSGAKYLFMGFPTGRDHLDGSKIIRGCKLIQLPAYCEMNPVALFAARFVMRESYRKLTGIVNFRRSYGLPA